jgi:hypothetical protein
MTAIQITEAYNLFRSFHGTTLPLEVCLKIVEEVVDIDPKNVQVLLCLSKVGYTTSKLSVICSDAPLTSPSRYKPAVFKETGYKKDTDVIIRDSNLYSKAMSIQSPKSSQETKIYVTLFGPLSLHPNMLLLHLFRFLGSQKVG